MHLDHLAASRARVQRVDVLGDHRVHEPTPLELGEREVAGVRLGGEQRVDPCPVETPDALGIAPKAWIEATSSGSTSAQIPVGERKSGMPLSVEMPAPVSTTQG